jgi:hypothetical protein
MGNVVEDEVPVRTHQTGNMYVSVINAQVIPLPNKRPMISSRGCLEDRLLPL